MKCWCDMESCGPATYMWLTKAGNEIPLCISCCAQWRQFDAEDTGAEKLLAPVRISLLESADVR